MDLPKLWALIEADLARARSTLPDDALNHNAIRDYQEFLDHNELELACDRLEAYAEDHEVSREFWLALRDAAIKMQLPKAARYEAHAKSMLENSRANGLTKEAKSISPVTRFTRTLSRAETMAGSQS